MTTERETCVLKSWIKQIEFILYVINQFCLGFITIFMSWLCIRNGLSGTALHAWLVTIGFSFLMAEGIMCHYDNNILTWNLKRNTKTYTHAVLQILGGGCGIAGALIKLIPNEFVFHDTHAKLGFSTFILCLVSMCAGLLAFCASPVRRILSPLLNKTFHNLLGIATFVVAITTQYYGYEKRFFTRNNPTDMETLMKCLSLISLVLTCLGPLKALYHKICNIMGANDE